MFLASFFLASARKKVTCKKLIHSLLFYNYKNFVEHHVIKLISLKISKLSARLNQAIIRDKLQRLKDTQDICTRQLITMFK